MGIVNIRELEGVRFGFEAYEVVFFPILKEGKVFWDALFGFFYYKQI
jgi:hypothetical protein